MSTNNKTQDERIDSLFKKMNELEGMLSPNYSGVAFTGDEIDFRELWRVIWKGKWIIVGVTFVFAVASVAYALNLPNIYKSDALLAPSEESKGGGCRH